MLKGLLSLTRFYLIKYCYRCTMVQVGKRVDLFKRWWTFRITCCDQVKTASLGLLLWPSWQQLSENPLHHCQKALTAHQTPERGWNQIRSSWNKCPVPSCVTDSTKKIFRGKQFSNISTFLCCWNTADTAWGITKSCSLRHCSEHLTSLLGAGVKQPFHPFLTK